MKSRIKTPDTKRLSELTVLSQSGDSWAYSYRIYGSVTKFELKLTENGWLIFLCQNPINKGIWDGLILLGVYDGEDDLSDLFTAVTRGDKLWK
tara:strand:- start:89 stop:367 length:279 start_codon:yes stop_codon:yes gene_type:complete